MPTFSQLPRVQQSLWLATQAEKATGQELKDLLELAEGQRDLQRAIAARWAQIDPRHMFLTMKEAGNSTFDRILFETWAKADAKTMLGDLQAFREGSMKRALGDDYALASHYLMRYAPDEGIEAFRTLGIHSFIPSVKGVAAWAEKNPRLAAEQVMTLQGNVAGEKVMKEVGKTWGKLNPKAAMEYARSQKNELGFHLAESAMSAWMAADPEAAEAFVKDQDPFFKAQLGQGLAAGLAESDPTAALNWAQAHLHSKAKAKAVAEIVKTVSDRDMGEAADLVAALPPGGVSVLATEALMRRWSREGKLIENDRLFNWIDQLKDTESQKEAMESVSWRLNHADSLVDFVAGKHGHLSTESMVKRAAEQRTRQDPESALNWAKSLPEGHRRDLAITQIAKVKETLLR